MSTKKVVVLPKADADIDEALAYYASHAPRMAEPLLAELEKLFARLRKASSQGSPRYARELAWPGLRHWRLTRFPYLVFHIEGELEVRVIRILHEKRDIPPELS